MATTTLEEVVIVQPGTVGQDGFSLIRPCPGDVSMDSENLTQSGSRSIDLEMKSLAL